MGLKEDIRPISYFKTHAAAVLDQVTETKRPMIITQNGEARAVLQDTESFEKMKMAIAILRLVAQGEKDIRDGHWVEHDEVFNEIERNLNQR